MLPPLNMRATHCPVSSPDVASIQASRLRWCFLVPASKLRAIALMALLPLVGQNVSAQPIICRVSDPTVTTDTLSSGGQGGLKIGISTNGGGYITQLYVPGIGSVMDKTVLNYGRGGQSCLRDFKHGMRYNPTAAGFCQDGGTVCTIDTTTPGRIILPNRPCALWYGDHEYYFSCNADLANDNNPDPGDNDLIDDGIEINYPKHQAQEITSEWNLYQEYQDKKGMTGNNYGGGTTVNIPAIRHYYQYDFVRDPSATAAPLKQFPNDTTINVSDISSTSPDAVHQCGAFDMGVLLPSFSWRFQKSIWYPPYAFAPKTTDNENTMTATDISTGLNQGWVTHDNPTMKSRVTGYTNWFQNYGANSNDSIRYSPLIILSDGSNPATANALGIFFPPTGNNNLIAGVKNGNVAYTDNRRIQTRIMLNHNGGAIMMAAQHLLTGLLSPKGTAAYDFERLRGEVYFLSGTPKQIYINAKRICDF
jgi:hypothetical protein